MGVSDLGRALERLRPQLRMPSWNEDGFKTGLCRVAPPRTDHSVLGLCNSAGFHTVVDDMHARFASLWRVKAHAHHYTEYGMDSAEFDDASEALRSLGDEYRSRTLLRRAFVGA